MEKHNIDKLFSDKLAGHTPAFNPAHWSQMEGIIQDQGNSGSLLWWMIGAGLLVLTAVGLSSNHYLGASEGNSLLIENPTYSREAIVLKHVDQHEHTFVSTATLSTFENGDSSESISTIPANEMNDASIHAKSKNENGIPNNTQATSDVSSANDTKPENPADRLAAKTNDKSNDTDLNGSNDLGHPDAGLSIASNNIASNDNDTQSEEGETKDEVDSSDDLPDSNQDSATISNPPIVAAKYTPPTNPLTKSDYDPNFKISQSGDSGSSMSNAGINALKILDPKGEFANDLMAPEFIEPEIINLPPVDFYKPYKWAVSGSAGMYASSKLIESDYDWLNPFTDKRNTEEQSNMTPAFGVELSFVPDRASFSTGIHFNSVSYEANYSGTETQGVDSIFDNSFYEFTTWEETLIDSVWQDTSNNQGGEIWIIDTIYITMIDTLLVQSFDTTFTSQMQEFEQGLVTTYQYLEVPIHVGYTLPFGQKATYLGVYGGVSLTYLRSTTGAYINQGLDEIQIAQKKETAVGLDLIARLRVTQGIGYRTSVYVEGRYRHGMGSVSTSADYSEKHRLYGGAIGLSYKF